ncbi:helix-turn-helix domain-containing protein [Streptomyces sp. B6B3]|uniref:PucR family transcriptional regulator n=1 Tax=Streptomyces sp. B6B3 TaxID=3153570 RepID=UPI00325E4147
MTALSHIGPGEDDSYSLTGPTAMIPAPRAPGDARQDLARQELLALLTGETTIPDDDLAALARDAGWPLPERVQAVVLAASGEPPLPTEVFGELLAGPAGGQQQRLLLPDPSAESRAALRTALRGRSAAVGHEVPLHDAASSMRWASRLLSLAPGLHEPGDAQPVFVDDHLTTLLLLQDESLVRALAARWLGPMEGLTDRQCERLEGTLLAWLEGGGVPEAARALQVHPQTVHYRLRQLEKLFGPTLRDPLSRFELEMTLHSRRLVARMRNAQSRASRRAKSTALGLRHLRLSRESRVNGR